MRRARRFSLLLTALAGMLLSQLSQAEQIEAHPELGAVFKTMGVTGTFVLFDVANDVQRVYSPSRAQVRYFPASTFKIPNSLIGLETGAVKDLNEVFRYDGKPRMLKAWEQDMTLAEAIRASNVPVYQEIARRVGLHSMASWVDKLDYGNRQIGKMVDQFWLGGPLKISALEQTRFLAKLAQKKLPFSEQTIDAVHAITLHEQTETYQIHAKTGWSNATKPGIGWWVGWVKRGDQLYPFALNIDIRRDEDAALRVPLARQLLSRLGVI
ncbi:class D beta-lactamase [Chitinivorax tropicus]